MLLYYVGLVVAMITCWYSCIWIDTKISNKLIAGAVYLVFIVLIFNLVAQLASN